MIKKILYSLMVVIIVVGAVYSYNKVNFGRNTAMLFQVLFGDASSMGPGGRPPMDGNRGEGSAMRPEGGPGWGSSGEGAFQRKQPQGNTEGQRPDFPQGGERRQMPAFQPGGEGGQRPQGNMRRGGGPGGIISLKNVIPYAFIFSFFVLITCRIEGFVRRAFYSKSS
jgi:hypothetical protein